MKEDRAGGERILVVEDEEDIARLVRYNLEREGFRTSHAASGDDAVGQASAHPPNLVVLDLLLPGIDGFEVLRRMKGSGKTARIPVVILSAKGEDADIVAGLELGADDYVTKPFNPRVLVARVRAVLRRRRPARDGREEPIRVHGIEIDPGRRAVSAGGRRIDLSAAEFSLLAHLAARPGQVFSRGQLIAAVHGEDYPVTDRSIDVQVVGLRRKLGAAGAVIETVRGVGYRCRE